MWLARCSARVKWNLISQIIHRDLAARNVLVRENETCKVTDFGMPRDVQEQKKKGLYHVGNWPTVWDCHAILCRYWRKLRKVLLIMSLLSKFHALRVAPKTIGHEVKAVCVKLIEHLTVQKKHKRLFCRSPKHGITLHILGVYGSLSVVI